MRRGSAGVRHLLALPLKDALLFAGWVWGLGSPEVNWRGDRLAVRAGTRLEPILATAEARWRSAPASMVMFATRLFR